MRRLPEHGIEPSDVEGDVLQTEGGESKWGPLPPHPLGTLTDVDTTTTPPEHGDSLTYDVETGTWIPTTPTPPSPTLVPLTTTVGGVPELVWDDDDQLVMTEVS